MPGKECIRLLHILTHQEWTAGAVLQRYASIKSLTAIKPITAMAACSFTVRGQLNSSSCARAAERK